jgi:hypothetical protein
MQFKMIIKNGSVKKTLHRKGFGKGQVEKK